MISNRTRVIALLIGALFFSTCITNQAWMANDPLSALLGVVAGIPFAIALPPLKWRK